MSDDTRRRIADAAAWLAWACAILMASIAIQMIGHR